MKVQALAGVRRLLRRIRQTAYLSSHPIRHRACANIIRSSQLYLDRKTSFKYVGDHLALGLNPSQRREILATHYSVFPNFLQPAWVAELRGGVPIWRKRVGDGLPDLRITMEISKHAPMEGELQLKFSFIKDLCVLTFTIAPGKIFGIPGSMVLFIGGVQGGIGIREEVRQAARLNDEISPALILILAVQALAEAINVAEIIAVGENEQISRRYAQMSFDYEQFWTKVGGTRRGNHYRLPMHSPQKPLSFVTANHRSRARRRRETKAAIRQMLDKRFRELLTPSVRRSS